MRYLSIGLDKASVIVEVDVCQRCFSWSRSKWWQQKLWQHPMSGKIHEAHNFDKARTSCGVRIPVIARVADKHIAVNIS